MVHVEDNEEIRVLKEQLRSREDALRDVYELIYLGEAASSPAREPS